MMTHDRLRPNKPHVPNPAIAVWFQIEYHWRGVSDGERSLLTNAVAKKLVLLCHVFAVVLLVSGCASNHPKLVNADAIPAYGDKPLYYTVYAGSDSQYHYFEWNRGLRSGQMKVEKAYLKLSREFALGADTMFVRRADDGKLELMIPAE